MTAAPSLALSPASSAGLRKNTLIAMLLTAVAYAYFNIGDAALKMLTLRGFHFSQIIVTNGCVIIACMCLSGAVRQGKAAFKMQKPMWVLIRALLSVGVSLLNTAAMPHIKLTTFYTLVFTSPFWVALLAAVFLKEKLELRRVLVILAGFAVIMGMFPPGSGLLDKYALYVLIGAFLYSCSMVVMRSLGPKESRTMIISMGSFMGVCISLPYLPSHFIWPTMYEWGLFFMMGVLGAISVTCIAYAFQNAPSASVVAPFHYTQIVWGALLGYFLFNEMPETRTIIGACCIIGLGLYLILSETRRKPPVPDAEGAVISS
ncbi:MAG: DMT family transporter [Micavibrio sp.]|nr:DMT family transporter [Micavibrio sp.]